MNPTTSNATAPPPQSSPLCGSVDNELNSLSLRIASVFVVMCTSLSGSLFPVLSRRTKFFKIPPAVFDFAKYFGSGVIVATAFIHLLAPAADALTSSCLTGVWTQYPWAFAISMTAVFGIFFLELFAFRWGSSKLAKLGIHAHDPHGHDLESEGSHAAHGPESQVPRGKSSINHHSSEAAIPHQIHHDDAKNEGVLDDAIAQVLGIAILEFGVVFHSFIIGLTLAVDPEFKVLFIVIVFHQMFEGLGLGARLAFMDLPEHYNYIPIFGAILYGLTTPFGIALGLGIRNTYNPRSTTASIISGVLDASSSGILLYTGLVELLAHEFLFNPKMNQASNARLAFASISMLTGAAIMALLGRWA
ncbi:ZIP-like iron-zinc transporter [Ramaria rubella]|nr:ZIP-like iron-zinc transporter [Ramaria rubella]